MSEIRPAASPDARVVIVGIVVATVSISVLHSSVPPSHVYWHNVFQHLYYLPTVLSALFFGWRGGLAAGLVAGISHLPDIWKTSHGTPGYAFEQLIEIPVLCSVGVLTGIFSDRDRKHRQDIERTTARLTAVYRELQQNFERMKRAERLFAVGQLAAGLAHELRNPLGSIAGAAGILQRNACLEPRSRECLEIIQKESQRLNRLLTDFLDFARPRPPKYQTIDADLLLNSVVQLASHGLGNHTARLIVPPSPPLPPIEGDPELLKQTLLNLVINAIQATPDGGEVIISAAAQEESVRFQVRDQGCGVAPEIRDSIFDPFFTTKDAGTGLGLSVAHQIVEQHGGILRAETNPDRGMTFSVQLPLHREVTA